MIDYHVDSSRGVVVTRVTGRVTFGEFANHLQRILRDRHFRPHFNSLIVATNKEAIPAMASLQKIRPLLRAWSMWRSGVKWAVVLPDEESRFFAETALLELELSKVTARCFISESAALEWLGTTVPKGDAHHRLSSAQKPATPVISRSR